MWRIETKWAGRETPVYFPKGIYFIPVSTNSSPVGTWEMMAGVRAGRGAGHAVHTFRATGMWMYLGYPGVFEREKLRTPRDDETSHVSSKLSEEGVAMISSLPGCGFLSGKFLLVPFC